MAKLIGTGGGSNKQVTKPVKYGDPRGARVVNPPGASQLGQHLGNHSDRGTSKGNPASPLYGGAVGGKINVKLGNQVSAEYRQGPGGGRTVMAKGTQDCHGAPVPGNPPAHRGLLGEYGPEISTSGRKR
jgi:hypothetical protein